MQDPNTMNKDELLALAQERDIAGRSGMNRDTLVRALLDAASVEDLTEIARSREIPGRSSMDKAALLAAVLEGTTFAAADSDGASDGADSDDASADGGDASDADGDGDGDGTPVVPPPFETPVVTGDTAPVQKGEHLDQPDVPAQEFGADDRLGAAPPDAPEGFVPTYHVDPDAKMADVVFLDDAVDPPEGYVKPVRPVAMTSVAHYPTTNTI